MSFLTLAEIGAKFARLDGIADEATPAFIVGLRNLVGRHFLPPTEQRGRVYYYSLENAAVIRLAQIAAEFGCPREHVDALARWLLASGHRQKPVAGGGYSGGSRIAEAFERIDARESFAIFIAMRADRSIAVGADWVPDEKPSERVQRALELAGMTPAPEIARFSLPSTAIAEALRALGEC